MHVAVNQKYIGHLVAILAVVIVLAPMFGLEHNLLIYGAGPWSYTEMRGFGPSIGPWAWFKLYWAGWALLLAVMARLLWVRGRENGFGARVTLARRRYTRPTAWAAALAVGLIVGLGGFIFYNTNVRATSTCCLRHRAAGRRIRAALRAVRAGPTTCWRRRSSASRSIRGAGPRTSVAPIGW